MAEERELSMSIATDGTVTMIYSDDVRGLAEKMGADIQKVQRASNVEWEEIPRREGGGVDQGWTVRAAHDPTLALRIFWSGMCGVRAPAIVCSRERQHPVAVFVSREAALKQEVKFFYELLPPKGEEKKEA